MKTIWTPELVERLRVLWDSGLSAGQCAAILGRGVSRNAVMGKVHRAGMTARIRDKTLRGIRPNGPRAPRKKRAHKVNNMIVRAEAPRALYRPKTIPVPPDSVPVGLMALSGLESLPGMCRWPVGGDMESTLFCGAPREKPPYCPWHSIAAFAPRVR